MELKFTPVSQSICHFYLLTRGCFYLKSVGYKHVVEIIQVIILRLRILYLYIFVYNDLYTAKRD